MKRLANRSLLALLLASTLAAAATPSPDAARAESELAAAERLIRAHDDPGAERALARIPAGTLDVTQLARSQIIKAQIALARNLPQAALQALPQGSAHVPQLAPLIEALRGQAYFAGGDALEAVRTLVAREHSLAGAPSLAENRDLIWSGLLATPLRTNTAERLPALDPVSRGWLDLALVLQAGPTEANLAAWRARNPGHVATPRAALVRANPRPQGTGTASLPTPATVALPAAAGTDPAAAASLAAALAAEALPAAPAAAALPAPSVAGGYALILPLGGALASSGRAVRDGFLSAWYALPTPRPPVRVYDAGGSAAQAAAAAQSAVADGAAMLVGPLTKEAVAAVAGNGTGGRGWIALNQLDQPVNGLQFGLAPEDEARAAARAAVADGRTRALVLAPENDWGQRVSAAFENELRGLGGSVLKLQRYGAGVQDFGKPLKALMNLDQSTTRHRTLVSTLGVPSEFEPRPRGDADFLFAPMRPVEARVLMPQLDFFRARKLPVYAPAAAYSGANAGEIDGLKLCDMPWLLASEGPRAAAREAARSAFPEALRDQPRLFALGADALQLAQAWQAGALVPGQELDGLSGRLRLESGGRVARALDCGAVRDTPLRTAAP